MLNLSGRHEATHDMLLARHALLRKALDHHERGEYEASVLIVLSQIDGLALDLTDPPFGFFYEPRPDEFEDQTTVAGMPVVLRAVWRAVIKSANTTSDDLTDRTRLCVADGGRLRLGAVACGRAVVDRGGGSARSLLRSAAGACATVNLDPLQARCRGTPSVDPSGDSRCQRAQARSRAPSVLDHAATMRTASRMSGSCPSA